MSGAGWKQLWVILFDNYCRSLDTARQCCHLELSISGHDEAARPRSEPQVCCMEICMYWLLRYLDVVLLSSFVGQPVRLEFLALESLAVRPVQRSNTLSRMMRTTRSESPGRVSPDPALSCDTGGDTFYPLSFHDHGRNGGSYTLYASTIEQRNEWRRKMLEAMSARKAAQEPNSIFSLETITSNTASSQEAPAHQSGLVTGYISCTLPFGAFHSVLVWVMTSHYST